LLFRSAMRLSSVFVVASAAASSGEASGGERVELEKSNRTAAHSNSDGDQVLRSSNNDQPEDPGTASAAATHHPEERGRFRKGAQPGSGGTPASPAEGSGEGAAARDDAERSTLVRPEGAGDARGAGERAGNMSTNATDDTERSAAGPDAAHENRSAWMDDFDPHEDCSWGTWLSPFVDCPRLPAQRCSFSFRVWNTRLCEDPTTLYSLMPWPSLFYEEITDITDFGRSTVPRPANFLPSRVGLLSEEELSVRDRYWASLLIACVFGYTWIAIFLESTLPKLLALCFEPDKKYEIMMPTPLKEAEWSRFTFHLAMSYYCFCTWLAAASQGLGMLSDTSLLRWEMWFVWVTVMGVRWSVHAICARVRCQKPMPLLSVLETTVWSILPQGEFFCVLRDVMLGCLSNHWEGCAFGRLLAIWPYLKFVAWKFAPLWWFKIKMQYCGLLLLADEPTKEHNESLTQRAWNYVQTEMEVLRRSRTLVTVRDLYPCAVCVYHAVREHPENPQLAGLFTIWALAVPAFLNILVAWFYPGAPETLLLHWIKEYETDVENYRYHRLDFLEELIGQEGLQRANVNQSKLTRSYVSKPHRLLARFKTLEYVDLSRKDLCLDEGRLIIQLLFGQNALHLERNELATDCSHFDLPLEEPQDLVTERLNLAENKQLGKQFAEMVITALLLRQGRDGLSEETYESITKSLLVPKNDKHLTAPPFVLKRIDLDGTSVPKKYSDMIAAMLERDSSNKFEFGQAEETQRIKLPRMFGGQRPARAFRSRDTYDSQVQQGLRASSRPTQGWQESHALQHAGSEDDW